MYENHKSNCQCCVCKGKRGEFIKHKLDCHCSVCKAKRGENTGWHHTKETKKKIGIANAGKIRTKEVIRKNSEGHIGTHQSKETKQKHRKNMLERWQNPVFREKQIKAMFKSLDIKPNKPEQLLNDLLQELFPNQYKYVGDGSILIGYKNPDFINVADHKIIEMYGDYWHSRRITKRSRIEEEKTRIKHFTKYGYQTLIVWEYELKDIEKLKDRLRKFQKC